MPRVVVSLRLLAGLAIAAGATLSACSKKSESDPLLIEPRNDIGTNEDKFGKGFGAAFDADPNSEPREVHEGDLAPVSMTTEPVAID